MTRVERIGGATLHLGDCREVMAGMEPCSVDAVVTDPPYHLTSGKAGGSGPKSLNPRSPAGRSRIGTGFMGKAWDGGDIAFRVELWAECLRVLKPGGYLVAFGGSRTYHQLACAVEDAGFVLHPMFGWLRSQGFPKAVNVSKAMDKEAGAERATIKTPYGGNEWYRNGGQNTRPWMEKARLVGFHEHADNEPITDAAPEWSGFYYGRQSLAPSLEPAVMAQKPFDGRALDSIRRWGVGALDIDGNRTPPASDADIEAQRSVVRFNRSHSNGEVSGVSLNASKDGSLNRRDRTQFDPTKGRWPSQIAHDGSPAVLAEFAKEGVRQSGTGAVRRTLTARSLFNLARQEIGTPQKGHADSGTVARYFTCCPWEEGEAPWLYEPKVSTEERAGCTHPTMKPVRLMEHLIRLTTREAGLVLDPFAGSGTTLLAALRTKRRAIGIELEPEHFEQAIARLRGAKLERRPAAQAPADLGPLFAAGESA